MRIDHYHHFHGDETLQKVLRALGTVINQGARTMSKLDDVLAAQAETAVSLGTMATDLAEVGTDLDALIVALGSAAEDPAKMDAALANAQSIRESVGAAATGLRAAADKFTPPA